MARVALIVLDSVGIGEMPDAGRFGDSGANTLRSAATLGGGLNAPNLEALGLGNLCPVPGLAPVEQPRAVLARLAEASDGKDTVTGHWEMAGLVSLAPFATYHQGFPPEILDRFEEITGFGYLGNKAASGTEIIEELGPEHLETGKLIVYTSADSVFQIAAHEDKVPLETLYRVCLQTRELLDPYRVARVIARPFVGAPGSFKRTYNRKDFSMEPAGPTVLDRLSDAGVPVLGIGKIHDIFAGRGVAESIHTEGNTDGLNQTLEALDRVKEGLIFVNLVDFDMLWGHRRNPEGYARALDEVDRYLPGIMARLKDDDLLILTADHGCDPGFAAHTDHTREYVPFLMWSPAIQGRNLGDQPSFTFVADTVARHLGL